MLAWWARWAAPDQILLVHGGYPEDCDAIAHPQKLFADDPSLRTRDHQREKQSYAGVFAAAAGWLAGTVFSRVLFCEYDHVPIAGDLFERLESARTEAGAGVLGHRVLRVDGTSHAHWRYHAADPAFAAFWKTATVRRNPATVYTMLGSGSYWTREAFLAVGRLHGAPRIYLELYLPTAAHHLGFRVRPMPADQAPFALPDGDFSAAVASPPAGAWMLHPAKRVWGV